MLVVIVTFVFLPAPVPVEDGAVVGGVAQDVGVVVAEGGVGVLGREAVAGVAVALAGTPTVVGRAHGQGGEHSHGNNQGQNQILEYSRFYQNKENV